MFDYRLDGRKISRSSPLPWDTLIAAEAFPAQAPNAE